MKLTTREVERFWSSVDQSGGRHACWLWKKSADSHGYGQFYVKRLKPAPLGAHRIAYLLHNRRAPRSNVCHRCDEPRCCNPSHLFLGTQRDNLHDMHRKGRGSVGSKHYLAKLTEERVAELRRAARQGRSIAVLVKETGIGRNAIRCAVRGITWKSVNAAPVDPSRR